VINPVVINPVVLAPSYRLLVIDDNRAIHDDIRKIFAVRSDAGKLEAFEAELFGAVAKTPSRPIFAIDSAYQGQEGLALVEQARAEGRPYHVAFVDVRMPPGWDGVETLEHLWQADPGLQAVICTAYADYSWTEIIARLGRGDQFLILKKPFDPIEMSQLAAALSRKRILHQQVQEQLDALDHLVQQRTGELQEANAKLREEISQREKMELELRLAQKLEAVGQLAAGIAHEINTPIQYVGDSVHFLKGAFDDLSVLLETYQEVWQQFSQTPEGAAWQGKMQDAEDAADLDYLRAQVPQAFERTEEGVDRVAGIVRAMKEFAHPDQREQSSADLNKALLNTLIVARSEYKYVADLETELGELPLVLCYVSDLNQVFLNLVVNAAHAIGDVVGDGGGKGRITIRSRDLGERVEITIADTGSGIPETIRDRVFDPFFTTKPVGKGTGQGLAIARSIVVDKHRGTLTFDSATGQGTTFYIRLPVGGRIGDGAP
jgi:signal transduction histidine kinase